MHSMHLCTAPPRLAERLVLWPRVSAHHAGHLATKHTNRHCRGIHTTADHTVPAHATLLLRTMRTNELLVITIEQYYTIVD